MGRELGNSLQPSQGWESRAGHTEGLRYMVAIANKPNLVYFFSLQLANKIINGLTQLNPKTFSRAL